jgi:Arm DNA-binding domain
MGREINRLKPLTVAKLSKAGRYADGGGLYLDVSTSGAKKWLFFFKRGGKRREMGLGSFQAVPLAAARAKAASAREALAAGRDPISERKAAEAEQERTSAVPTFGEMADELMAGIEAGFRNDKHKAQWRMTLEVYAEPLRTKPVNDITTEDVLAVLKPLWTEKHETASRLRGRIEKVLSAAKAKRYRSGENPAQWKGHLDHLLPKKQKLTRGHHKAMPWRELPTFVRQLRELQQNGSIAAYALEFLILTASRTGGGGALPA